MTNQELATRLYDYVQRGEYFEAYDELFSAEAKAIEPQLAQMGLGEVVGREAIKAKVGQMSEGIAELISREMSAPIVSAKHIAFTNIVKARMKDGNEFSLSEICLYEVEEGKIISEQFFY
ncbi:MAG: nuclear transport factor 2 family protein [Bacteroidia bacterium]|nr:nuclear transport factor 2 family protein [Bacteroidia bacterium]